MITDHSWSSLLPGCCGGGRSRPRRFPSSMPSSRYASSRTLLSFSDVSGVFSPEDLSQSLAGTDLCMFTLKELKLITRNFSMTNFLGEGGFGRVYKGLIGGEVKPGLKGQAVAVKQLDLEGAQGHKEWLAEVIYLGQLRHPHLVKLIGYCIEDEHRLLVYELMSNGSLENHLFKRLGETLPWSTRLKIAVGAAKGLAFLHEEEIPVIYRDFKASNILLDSDYEAKLSDFGLAKDGPMGEDTHVSTRVMGTHGYAAPEYIMTGHLTTKSDVYSFGVVLLELLTGRRCVDGMRTSRERNLVEWARPSLKDHRKLRRIIDPALGWEYSTIAVQEVAAIAHRCLSHKPKSRLPMSIVVQTLEPLLEINYVTVKPFVYIVPPSPSPPPEMKHDDEVARPKHPLRSRKLGAQLAVEKRLYRAQLSTGRMLHIP